MTKFQFECICIKQCTKLFLLYANMPAFAYKQTENSSVKYDPKVKDLDFYRLTVTSDVFLIKMNREATKVITRWIWGWNRLTVNIFNCMDVRGLAGCNICSVCLTYSLSFQTDSGVLFMRLTTIYLMHKESCSDEVLVQTCCLMKGKAEFNAQGRCRNVSCGNCGFTRLPEYKILCLLYDLGETEIIFIWYCSLQDDLRTTLFREMSALQMDD